MPGKNSRPRRKNRQGEFLELHIEENGKINFSNLSRKTIAILEKMSGKKQDHREFYCG